MEALEFRSTATVKGTLYKVDWYPAVVLDPNGTTVVGEIHLARESQLPSLDAYEGSEYRRVKTTATDPEGKDLEVWIWEWIGPTDSLSIVANGDWLRDERLDPDF